MWSNLGWSWCCKKEAFSIAAEHVYTMLASEAVTLVSWFDSLSCTARLLPEAEAERRGRAESQRENGWRAVTQAGGPKHTPFPQRTRHSGTNPPPPAPPNHSGTAEAAVHNGCSKACPVHWICPTPRPLTPETQHCHTHLAFLHCYDTRTLFVCVFLRPSCHPFTDLEVLLAWGWSSGAFSGRLTRGIERALISLFQQFAPSANVWQLLFCLFPLCIYLTLMVIFEIHEKPQGWLSTQKLPQM